MTDLYSGPATSPDEEELPVRVLNLEHTVTHHDHALGVLVRRVTDLEQQIGATVGADVADGAGGGEFVIRQ